MTHRNFVTKTLVGAAVGAVSILAFAPAASATHDGTASGESSASTGTGALFENLDTGACTATDTATTTSGTPSGRCGNGLSLNAQINAFSQNASAPGDGTSTADASVAPIDIKDFTALDLTGILDGLAAIDTGTVLDDVIDGLDPATQLLLTPEIRQAAIAPLDDALQDALVPVNDQLPLTLRLGTVESQCTATSDPLRATGNGTVDTISLFATLGSEDVAVPVTAGTAPNTNLVVGAPQQLTDDIIDGLKDTFTNSLGGALSPLTDVLGTLQTQVTDEIFAQLEPTLLQALADGLEPLIKGTVNKQDPVSPSSTGEIQVTALDLTLLEAAGANAQRLQLARSNCGPNVAGVTHTDDPSRDDTPAGGDNPGDATLPSVPTRVTSGAELASSDLRNDRATVLGAMGALLLMAGAGGLMRRRFSQF